MAGMRSQLPVQLGPRAVGPLYFSDVKPRNIPDPVVTSWTDNFVDLSHWVNGGVAPTLLANRVYGNSGAVSILQRPILLGTGRQMRFTARFHEVDPGAGSSGSVIGIYVTSEDPSVVAAGSTAQFLGIFVTLGIINLRKVSINVNGANPQLNPISTTNQDYIFGIDFDETYFSLYIRSADGLQEQRGYGTRAALGFVPSWVGLYSRESRGTAGSSLGPVAFRGGDIIPVIPKDGMEDVTAAVITRENPTGQINRVAIPTTYDPATPCPLVLYCHGGSGSYTEPADNPIVQPTFNALMNMGFMVASSQEEGDAFGNNASLNDVHSTYQWCLQHFNIGPILLVGYSMGGMLGLLVGDGRIPLSGYVSLAGLCNLAWFNVVVQDPTSTVFGYLSAFESAYGLSAGYTLAQEQAATAGHDPMLLPISSWGTLPMLFSGSPRDTIVDDAQNARELFNNLLNAGHPHLYQHYAPGDHTDASQFPQSVITTFAQAVLTGVFPDKLEPDPVPQSQPMLPRRMGPQAVGPRYFAELHVTPPQGLGFAQTLSAVSTTTVGLVNQTQKLLAASSTATAGFVRQVGTSLKATAVGTTAIVKQVGKRLLVTSVGSAALASMKVILLTLAAAAAGTAALVRSVGKGLVAPSTGSPAAVRQIAHALTTTSVGAVTLARQTGKGLSVTATGAASIAKRVGKALVGTSIGQAILQTLKQFGAGATPTFPVASDAAVTPMASTTQLVTITTAADRAVTPMIATDVIL